MSKVPKRATKDEKRAKVVGASMAVVFHLLLVTLFFTTGFKVIYPPPTETGIEIDFELDPPKPIQVNTGQEPRIEHPTPKEEIRLVQKSESAIIGKKTNTGAESTMGKTGDIEQFEPPRPIPIDRRALFPSASNADSTAPQTARNSSKKITAGHPMGNTKVGAITGEPQAKLAGRSIMGSLPKPDYKVNKSGKVVVKISVDQYGSVVNATPGAIGTTVQDKTLWEAAKKAALEAKFNLSSQAPITQEGTITYIFRLE